MKKAELLQKAIAATRQAIDIKPPTYGIGTDVICIDLDSARALVEALESLRWVNVFYTNPQIPGELGVEHEKFSDAYQAHTDVQKIGLSIPFETVGIIRLKDSQP